MSLSEETRSNAWTSMNYNTKMLRCRTVGTLSRKKNNANTQTIQQSTLWIRADGCTEQQMPHIFCEVTKRPEVEQNDATVDKQTEDLLGTLGPSCQTNLKAFSRLLRFLGGRWDVNWKAFGKIRRQRFNCGRMKSRPGSSILFDRPQISVSKIISTFQKATSDRHF